MVAQVILVLSIISVLEYSILINQSIGQGWSLLMVYSATLQILPLILILKLTLPHLLKQLIQNELLSIQLINNHLRLNPELLIAAALPRLQLANLLVLVGFEVRHITAVEVVVGQDVRVGAQLEQPFDYLGRHV